MKTQIKIKVRGYHIDHFGHVNHSRYLEFLEEGRWSYMEENHLLDLFHATEIIHVVTRIAVDYKHSAKVGDTIRIETALTKGGKSSFIMGQHIFLDTNNAALVDAAVTNVFIDKNRQKVVIPDNNFMTSWPDLAELCDLEKTNG